MMHISTRSSIAATILVALLGFTASTAFAHGDAAHGSAKTNAAISDQEHSFGKQGNAKKVDRTVAIEMSDMMRFSPADIRVKQGETIKFIVKNKGKMMHEMVIGTAEDIKGHAAMMQKHPGMEHDEPYMAHVRPGKREQMVWQFTREGEFTYACLVPGHFEAGMFGKIKVVKG